MLPHSNPTKIRAGLVYSSSDPYAPDPGQVGNKAANLWQLSKLGLRVPLWFVIPHNAF